MSSLKRKRKRHRGRAHVPTYSAQQNGSPSITARERHRFLTCFLQALVDSLVLTDGVRDSQRKSSVTYIPSSWGKVKLIRYAYRTGLWTGNHAFRFAECTASVGNDLCDLLDKSQESATAPSIRSVQSLVKAFLGRDATHERCAHVHEAIYKFLEVRGFVPNRMASALRDQAAVIQYVAENGLPGDAIRINDDYVSVDLGVVFLSARVPLAGIHRYNLKAQIQSELDEFATRSLWSVKSRLFIPTLNRAHGRDTRNGLIINFKQLNISRNGLLEDIIRNFSRPADHRNLQFFLRWIAWLIKSDVKAIGRPDAICISSRNILSTPTQLLTERDFYALMEHFRSRLASRSLKARTVNEYESSFRSLIKSAFERCGKSLRNYRVRKSPSIRRSSRGIVSSQPDPGATKEYLRPAIENVAVGNPQEARGLALEHLEDRSARIVRACNHEIQQFLSWRSFLTTADKLPGAPSREWLHQWLVGTYSSTPVQSLARWIERASPDEFASALIAATRERHLYEEKGFLKQCDRKHKVIARPLVNALSSKYPELPIWFGVRKPNPVWIALSYWYVPRFVQLAVQLRIQIATGWNSETVRNLCPSGITFTTDSIELQSTKDKTEQKQEAAIEHPDPLLRACFELMLNHDNDVSKYWSRESDSIFVSAITLGDKPVFAIFDDDRLLKQFIHQHGLPAFSREQLRNQCMATDFLSSGDPHRIQAKLGHAKLRQTSTYLGQVIFAVLNRANIAQFIRQLGATIVWAVEGESAVVNRGMSTSDINRRLLFPISDSASERSCPAECDAWMMDSNRPLVIDHTRIAHLVLQRTYYAKNWQRLRAESSIRFERIHRPRIEFTAALWAIISDSPYAHMLEQKT